MRLSYDLVIIRWMFDDAYCFAVSCTSSWTSKSMVRLSGSAQRWRVGSTPMAQVRGHETKKQTCQDL